MEKLPARVDAIGSNEQRLMALKDLVERNPLRSGADFIGAAELARMTGYSRSRIYAMYASDNGPLGHVLTKLGSRVGIWRPDWESFVKSQLRLPPTAPERVSA